MRSAKFTDLLIENAFMRLKQIMPTPRNGIIGGGVLLFGSFVTVQSLKFKKIITVKEKYIIREGERDVYMVVDDKTPPKVYKCDSAPFRLHYAQSELQGK